MRSLQSGLYKPPRGSYAARLLSFVAISPFTVLAIKGLGCSDTLLQYVFLRLAIQVFTNGYAAFNVVIVALFHNVRLHIIAVVRPAFGFVNRYLLISACLSSPSFKLPTWLKIIPAISSTAPKETSEQKPII